jgi:hypothetical protein
MTASHEPGPDAPGGADRRRRLRDGVLRRGRIVVAGTVLDCLVEDISPTGACVRLAIPTPVPEDVVLALTRAGARPARRRWMRGTRIGFAFVAEGTEGTAADRAGRA